MYGTIMRSYVTFDRKVKLPTTALDFIPIAVGNYFLHRISARRLERAIPASAQLTRFQRCDGVAYNVIKLQAVITTDRWKHESLVVGTFDIRKAFDQLARTKEGQAILVRYLKRLLSSRSVTIGE